MNPDANHSCKARLHAQTSKVAVWVIPAKEEEMIAADALTLLEAG
jgi:acetate kinase